MPQIIQFDEVGSTNDILKDMIHKGIESGTIVSAKRQTNGRGQYGRTWFSADGALAFSIALRFEKIPENFTVRVGECVSEAIAEIYKEPPKNMHIKLPNDILIGEKKVCGILTEAQTQNTTSWIVCGIGINVNTKTIPSEVKDIATSLYLETGKEIVLNDLITAIYNRVITIK